MGRSPTPHENGLCEDQKVYKALAASQLLKFDWKKHQREEASKKLSYVKHEGNDEALRHCPKNSLECLGRFNHMNAILLGDQRKRLYSPNLGASNVYHVSICFPSLVFASCHAHRVFQPPKKTKLHLNPTHRRPVNSTRLTRPPKTRHRRARGDRIPSAAAERLGGAACSLPAECGRRGARGELEDPDSPGVPDT